MRRRTHRQHNRKAAAGLDPIRLARAIRRRNVWGVLGVLVVVALIAFLDHAVGILPVDDDWHRYHGKRFTVSRVVDGDTLILQAPDGEQAHTRVRLWAVDTPELTKDAGGPSEPWAEQAKAYTRRRAEGRVVTLHLQPHRLRGGYGRLLAYVHLPDGSVLNEQLIAAGLSPHDDRWGHDRASEYEALEQQARRAGLGLWSGQAGTGADGTPALIRLH